jgi:hypothetical protein
LTCTGGGAVDPGSFHLSKAGRHGQESTPKPLAQLSPSKARTSTNFVFYNRCNIALDLPQAPRDISKGSAEKSVISHSPMTVAALKIAFACRRIRLSVGPASPSILYLDARMPPFSDIIYIDKSMHCRLYWPSIYSCISNIIQSAGNPSICIDRTRNLLSLVACSRL